MRQRRANITSPVAQVWSRVRMWPALALALASLALGCGDDLTPTPSWEQLCQEMSARELRRGIDCGVLWAPIAPSSYRSPLCDSIALSLSRGAVQLRLEEAGACLQRISSMPCGDVADAAAGYRSSCPELLTGGRAPGESCRNPWECADPERNTCERPGDYCATRCVARRGLGEPCEATADCLPGAVCPAACVLGAGECHPLVRSCTTLVGEGAPCGPGHGVCSALFNCNGASVCAARSPAGACDGNPFACSVGSACRTSSTGERACAPLKGPGDACQPGECSFATCGPDDSGGVCTQPPRLGDRCGYVLRELMVVGVRVCVGGWCDRQPGAPEGICRAFQRLGGPCVTSFECPSLPGVICSSGTCQEVSCSG